MGEALDQSALARWRQEPTRFIDEVLRNPETGRPFQLLPCERAFFAHAYQTKADGRLVYPEQVFACPKKSGKTAFAAMHLLTTTLVYGGRNAEGYALANDYEQAQGRVFAATKRIVEASPYLAREARVTANKLEFPATGATIQAIASDYASAAGANPVISCFDELWAYTSDRSYRLWDEMVPVPTRAISCRLVTTYAGFEGESELLEELYKRGAAAQAIGADLRAGDGLLFYWTHSPQAPWQTAEWVEQMRSSLRPNQFLRMIENRFVTSEEVFVPMAAWDACVNPQLRPVPADNTMRVWAAVDASVKHDSTAIACMTWHRDVKKARLVWHRIFQPSPDRSLDFEATIEQTLLELKRRFSLKEVRFDPWQMRATAQRLRRMGVPMVEFPQSIPNLTAASQNLFELIKSQGLMVYPDPDIRLAVSRAVAVEGSRGWKIAKEKSSHKIDIVVALAMAALATVQKGEAKQMRTGTYNPCGGDAHVHYKKDESQEFSRYRYITINADGSETSETRLLPRTGGGR